MSKSQWKDGPQPALTWKERQPTKEGGRREILILEGPRKNRDWNPRLPWTINLRGLSVVTHQWFSIIQGCNWPMSLEYYNQKLHARPLGNLLDKLWDPTFLQRQLKQATQLPLILPSANNLSTPSPPPQQNLTLPGPKPGLCPSHLTLSFSSDVKYMKHQV